MQDIRMLHHVKMLLLLSLFNIPICMLDACPQDKSALERALLLNIRLQNLCSLIKGLPEDIAVHGLCEPSESS